MKYRMLGKTGFEVSEIGYGAWSIGGDWGDVPEDQAIDTLRSAIENGVNFIDTADVYGDGRSEGIIGGFKKKLNKPFYIATKLGRRSNPHTPESYTKENMFAFVKRSLENLQIGCLDLLQLHCPPTQVYYMPKVFDVLDELVQQKIIRHYGVSVEKVEEGIKALQYPNVATVQIIFNMFRQRPMEYFFEEAARKNVGIIVRVPLASGLLTGKMDQTSQFGQNDHRSYNRHGEVFDRGETFAGIDYGVGLSAVEKLKKIKPEGHTMSQFALKWILKQKAVSTVIAGGKMPSQVLENCKASQLPPLSEKISDEVKKIYDTHIKELVHQRW